MSVVILAAFGTLAAVGLLIGLLPAWQAVSITSGSMRPGIVEGDLVLVNDAPLLIRQGQVVTYADPLTGHLTTHRIVAVNGDNTVTTKGEANRANDPISVPTSSIIGAARLIVPLIGHPALWISAGRYIPLTLVLVLGVGMIHVTRFVLSNEHDPWADDRS